MKITEEQVEKYFDNPESIIDNLSEEEIEELEMFVGQVAQDLGFLEDAFEKEDVQELLDARLSDDEIEELKLAVLDEID